MLEALELLQEELTQVVQAPIIAKTEEGKGRVAVDLTTPKQKLRVRLTLVPKKDVVVAHPTGRHLSQVIQACCDFGERVEAGSLFLPGGIDEVRGVGLRRQYLVYAGTPAGGGIPIDQWQQLHRRISEIVGKPLEGRVAAEDPYIFSYDLVEVGLGETATHGEENFVLCLHYHPMTSACYVEKLTVPPLWRGNGIGSRVVQALREWGAQVGIHVFYLLAKTQAEPFWERQGFGYLYRVNLRSKQRLRQAVRRPPGWERSWVGGERLPQPVWYYRNHPQDDLDFHVVTASRSFCESLLVERG